MLHEPDQMRRHHRKRHYRGHPGARGGQMAARVAVENKKQRERRRQHHHEIFGPPGEPDRHPEQNPVAEFVAAQRGVKGKTGQRP